MLRFLFRLLFGAETGSCIDPGGVRRDAGCNIDPNG